jgi:hypothetical protein
MINIEAPVASLGKLTSSPTSKTNCPSTIITDFLNLYRDEAATSGGAFPVGSAQFEMTNIRHTFLGQQQTLFCFYPSFLSESLAWL